MGQQRAKHLNNQLPATGSAQAYASRGEALIRTAFHKHLQDIHDPTQTPRLISKLTSIITSNPLHTVGQRSLPAADIGQLEGFEFCAQQSLLRYLLYPAVTVDRRTGVCQVQLSLFSRPKLPSALRFVTHLQVIAVACELDFAGDSFVAYEHSSPALNFNEDTKLTLQPGIPVDSALPIVVAVGVRLLQVINGIPYVMKQEGKIPFTIVKASRAVRALQVDVGSLSVVRGYLPKEEEVRKPEAGGKMEDTATPVAVLEDAVPAPSRAAKPGLKKSAAKRTATNNKKQPAKRSAKEV
ncbi:MAG: hypothetical protein DI539_19200 [Flavobacterium psychrophilum]|nr:MAG: hypothetical protein DI539_19200 [Flavobacterium psychrophilum]